MVFHSPVAIFAKAGETGKYRAALPAWNMVLRGFLAGSFIAMGCALATMCSTGIVAGASAVKDTPALAYGMSSAGVGQLVMGVVFPVGLFLVVITGAELFAGDAMLSPLAAFTRKTGGIGVVNLWVWVFIGNFIGAVFWAYLMANGPFIGFDSTGTAMVNTYGAHAIGIAAAKTGYAGGMGFWSAFLRGIGGIWLVNLAVLFGICADNLAGRILGIWVAAMAFIALGLEYVVANMYFIAAGILTQGFLTDQTKVAAGVNWLSMWTSNLIPVALGNIVGGLVFFGALYWVAFRKEIAALK
ncbi:MAG TPA: formate/nitrite transporter family protein [Methanoregula sp.]|nr:formate/nitrite transporter family protein [Methanoregula sp.]